MRPFRYLRDPLFLLGCAAYVVNRWLIKPHWHSGLFHSQFNDLWLIPCALPPLLWLHRRLGLRVHDEPPRLAEIGWHLLFWSILFEWIGPHFVPRATGDLLDVVAYAAGAVAAGLWWRRASLLGMLREATCRLAPCLERVGSEGLRTGSIERARDDSPGPGRGR